MSPAKKPSPSKTTKKSKPVIVTNRPILKDPAPELGEAEAEADNDSGVKTTIAHTAETIKPPKEEVRPSPEDPAAEEENEKPPEETPKSEDGAKETLSPETESKKNQQIQELAQKNDEQKARHEAVVERLVNSRKYELPINAVEKRKTKNFVVLGFLLSILLVLVWADVALDAGLVKLNGVKPVTHFFSN